MSAVKYERVIAEDVRVGDRIARARTHPFHTVTMIGRRGATSSYLYLRGAGRIRPRNTASLWREVPEAPVRETWNRNAGWAAVDTELEVGNVCEEAERVFTQGHCHSFAVAFADLTGGAILALGGVRYDEDGEDYGDGIPNHFCVDLCGEYWDVKGPLDEEAREDYGGVDEAPWTRDRVERDLCETAEYRELRDEDARPYAAAVAREAGLLPRYGVGE